MFRAAVVIPVYKEKLTPFEFLSLKQCLKILGKHDIYILTTEEIKEKEVVESLLEQGHHCRYALMDGRYLDSIEGYNRLLLSPSFYEHFSGYDYILIHQLDAFVFIDELEYWCSQNYDYIGAPWFHDHSLPPDLEKLGQVGNGGFSLRKVQSHISLLNSSDRFYSTGELLNEIDLKKNSFRINLMNVAYLLGVHNSIREIAARCDFNEDYFISKAGRRSGSFRIPSPTEAMAFAFDKNPATLYELNSKKLPFGCHGWWRNDGPYKGNLDFWRDFVGDL